MNRLKIAVIGVGALGRHHARILAGFDDVELIAVADTNPDTGRHIAELHGTRWVDGYADIIAQLDAVSIAVPTSLHRLVASDFLSRRIPVLVEKPLAGSLSDANELVRLAEANSTLLQVGHVERFNPATLAAWRLCGAPKYVRAERLSPYAFRSTDIGVVHDLMIHDLDLVLDLVGAPVRDVSALGFSILGEHEDVVQARIIFENGCVADLSANRVNPQARRSMDIWSGGGCVSVDFHERDVVSYSPTEELLHGTSLPERARKLGADVEQLKRNLFGGFIKVTTPTVDDRDALTDELRSFVDCVRQQRTPLVDGRAALAAMDVADRVLRSVAHHQWDGHAAGAIGPFAHVADEQRRAG
jgi:predicted dehydrogenase